MNQVSCSEGWLFSKGGRIFCTSILAKWFIIIYFNKWGKSVLEGLHSPAGELEMRKNLSKDFKGATRIALMRALKWAPTWKVSFQLSLSHPDLIQRLAIKGILDVSKDLSSGGSFCISHWGHSHGTLENHWEVFFAFRVSLPDCARDRQPLIFFYVSPRTIQDPKL